MPQHFEFVLQYACQTPFVTVEYLTRNENYNLYLFGDIKIFCYVVVSVSCLVSRMLLFLEPALNAVFPPCPRSH